MKNAYGTQEWSVKTVNCITGYSHNLVFLECEELGKADLNEVTDKKTTLEDHVFSVLKYDSNDFVPDPFAYLIGINHKNSGIWIEVMVNYCFRWVFGIKDSARRNFMLQRSTGNIYSVDETGIEIVNHQIVWNGKKPNEKVFKLISTFLRSKHLVDILTEVERWKNNLDHISNKIVPLSVHVEGRINNLVNHPIKVFDI